MVWQDEQEAEPFDDAGFEDCFGSIEDGEQSVVTEVSDLSTRYSDDLDSTFGDDTKAKEDWVAMKEWNVPMLDLNNDNTTLISLNNMTWLQGPFLPVSADK